MYTGRSLAMSEKKNDTANYIRLERNISYPFPTIVGILSIFIVIVAYSSLTIGMYAREIYLAPGWRIGYLSIRDVGDSLSFIRDGIERQARARLCVNSICQQAYCTALTGPKQHIALTMEKLRRRRDLSYKMINEIEGLSVQDPGGAFYMFPRIDGIRDGPWKDDKEFVLDLLNTEKVLTVNGSGFGKEYGADHFRIVILPDEDTLSDAYDRMGRFIRHRIG